MGLLGRVFDRFRTGGRRARRTSDVMADLRRWAAARGGVEAYVEPETTVTPLTVVLVAADGEWTRRAVDDAQARAIGRRLAIPVYDVQKVGYPRRMRDFDARRRLERRRELRADLEES